jgi:hypothetical protein
VTSRSIKSWIFPLKGHSFDLEDLLKYLAITVIKRDDKFFLQLPLTSTSEKQIIGNAENFLAIINGTVSVVLPNYRPVELESKSFYYGIDEKDTVAHTVIMVDSGEIRIKGNPATIVINGVEQLDPRKGLMSSFLDEASKNREKADALVIVGRSSPTWSELFLVYELVQKNVGRRMIDENWISQTNVDTFTRTANNYTALGRESRHGKFNWEPPPEPMERHVAVSLIRSLVSSWFQSNPATSDQNNKK